jgi:hypothetical protein
MPKRHLSRILNRFWARVDVRGMDECWEWQGTTRNGYGMVITRPPHTMIASRFLWEIHHRQEIPDGMFVCHTCDNPLCVNPAHLYLGTPLDNMRDMIERDRACWYVGEENPHAKLTEDQVREIRRLYAEGGWSYRRLAPMFGVNWSAIRQVVKRHTWKHIR